MTIGIEQIIGLLDFAADKRHTPVFVITDDFEDPKITVEHDHLIRIWRIPVKRLNPWELRQPCAILEVTDLSKSDPYPVGLHWSYSKHSKSGYVLHGHKPGSRRFEDLKELDNQCTMEIEHFVKRLNRGNE